MADMLRQRHATDSVTLEGVLRIACGTSLHGSVAKWLRQKTLVNTRVFSCL